jgi:hypothetical protein
MSFSFEEPEISPEDALEQMNGALRELSFEDRRIPEKPHHAPLFIIGAPRSGTTLLMQLVVYIFRFGYINNLLARFWDNPFVGASLVTRFQDFQRPPDIDFTSRHGFTPGYEGPHEFGYFWRRWFDYRQSHELTDKEIDEISNEEIQRAWAGMEAVFGLPIAHKNAAALSLNINFLHEMFPHARFIHCRRSPIYAAQSILLCRERLGTRQDWVFTRPREHEALREYEPAVQCAGQVHFIRQTVDNKLSAIPDEQTVDITYENYCADPEQELRRIMSQIQGERFSPDRRDVQLPEFENSNRQRVSDGDWNELVSALDGFQTHEGLDLLT